MLDMPVIDVKQEQVWQLATGLMPCIVKPDRFTRILTQLATVIPCDALALLSYQNGTLTPLAVQGLTTDTLGRRFAVDAHPRFLAISESVAPLRFASSSPLPDPYDGLMAGHKGDLPIHACMGFPLIHDGHLVGVATFDSLTVNAFENLDADILTAIASITADAVNTALTVSQLEQKNSQTHLLLTELNHDVLARDSVELIGRSAAMETLKKEIQLVAASNFSVLIQGETGVGKELVARQLHQLSARAQQPLVYVNCAALPEQLIESELFGHVKGAFTGADKDRAGKFKLANGGTLFLDEIGELPLAAQSKLLRALQSNEIQSVGKDSTEIVDVRVLAATNRTLTKEVEQGRFRADLFHRLSVYPIQIPALKNRGSDVEVLSGYFLERARKKMGLTQLKMAENVMPIFYDYHWPGNIRELEHVITRGALIAASEQDQNKIITIDAIHIEKRLTESSNKNLKEQEYIQTSSQNKNTITDLKEATSQYQKNIIVTVLEKNNGNWAKTARQLKSDRSNLIRLANRLGIHVKKEIKSEE